MGSKYYYLIAGLPDLALEDGKLNYKVSDFKSEFYAQLSCADQRLIDLFYLKFDNKNLLNLLKGKAEEFNPCGNFSLELLQGEIERLQDEDAQPSKQLPSYITTFLLDFLPQEEKDFVEAENRLTSLYYNHAMKAKNQFVASWFELNLSINNILLALTARKYDWDIASNVVGDNDVAKALRSSNARDFGLADEFEFFDAIIKISEIKDWVEREKKLDQLYWNWLDESTFFKYFTIERLFIFLLKIEMIERWISLDKEKGNELFRSVIETLKNEVSIPEEFRK